mgnify:CR=1|jgi:hypothetical protein
MKKYIAEKVKNTTRSIRFGNIRVEEVDPLPAGFNLQAILKTIEDKFPPHFLHGVKMIEIGHKKEFEERDINAFYKSGIFYITNRQDNPEDLLDDIVHEFAHHMETQFAEQIYSDTNIIAEFLEKRQQLLYELRSEGYWTEKYDFRNLKYDVAFDKFLYKYVGNNMLKMISTGLFIRPYAAVSLREYFATGFESYYLGKADELYKISPALYMKIKELHLIRK